MNPNYKAIETESAYLKQRGFENKTGSLIVLFPISNKYEAGFPCPCPCCLPLIIRPFHPYFSY